MMSSDEVLAWCLEREPLRRLSNDWGGTDTRDFHNIKFENGETYEYLATRKNCYETKTHITIKLNGQLVEDYIGEWC